MNRDDSERPIRVGLIGATPGRGWAGFAHVPAIKAVPGITLQAVATRSEDTARAAAAQFGSPLWFGDAAALIEHDQVDAVVVAVKTPAHYALAKQALLAGKPVFCEMPFCQTLEEARDLEQIARERGIVTAVGLQGRFSPWVRQVRKQVSSGALGRLLSISMIAYDELSLGTVDQGNAYLLDVRNGANPLTIHSAHYLDALCFAASEFTSVAAAIATSRPVVTVRQTGEVIAATSPDQVAVCGLLQNGAVASFHMRAGTGAPSFQWELQGDSAVLRVTSTGYLMWRPLTLERWEPADKKWIGLPAPADAGRWPGLDGPSSFVANVYEAFEADIRSGGGRSVSFSDALSRRELMEAVDVGARCKQLTVNRSAHSRL
jgi:predicted dehydrogenase